MPQHATVEQKRSILAENERKKKKYDPKARTALQFEDRLSSSCQKEPNHTSISQKLSFKSTFINLSPSLKATFKNLRSHVIRGHKCSLFKGLSDRLRQFSGYILTKKTCLDMFDANKHVQPYEMMSLKHSKGCLSHFQNRNGIIIHRVNGEELSVDETAL